MRTTNTTALKVRFISCTNTKGNRLSITQLNNKQRCIINCSDYETTQEQLDSILKGAYCVKSWNLIVDNTQSDFSLIALHFHQEHTLENVIPYFKAYRS